MTILARLQSATGPDRDINVAIALHLGWVVHSDWWKSPQGSIMMSPPAFTRSLKDAISLIGKEKCWAVGRTKKGFFAAIGDTGTVIREVFAPTPALAICTAWAIENTDAK